MLTGNYNASAHMILVILNSIEDAKQKAEHDRKMKLAEEKKQRVRKEVTGLRRQFYQVLLRNKELPAHLQLSTNDFIMDPEMEEKLAQKTREKVGGAAISIAVQ